MNKILAVLLVLITTTSGAQHVTRLIPQPVRVEQAEGVFLLTGTTTIAYNDARSAQLADMLAQRLNTPTGFALTSMQGTSGTIQLNLSPAQLPTLGGEGYTLDAATGRIVVTANTTAGLFYGMQTLLQLLPAEIEAGTVRHAVWTVPCVKITDYPRFPWRGVMLDVSRHFFTKEEVKRHINEIAKFKFNTFHWHLTDDQGWRIEIKSLPLLTSVGAWRVQRFGRFGERAAPRPGEAATDGGFYTQDDIREVVRYAAERNVTIVPEIDVPGHSMAAIASYPELSCKKDKNTRVDPGMHTAEWYGNGTFKILVENALNPSDEKVYEFLDKVFTEVAALFPGKYIHVGGDECYKGYWAQDENCRKLMKKLNTRHVEDLQGYFMNRVAKILSAKGKKMIGWDEIMEGGVSTETALMSWRGVHTGIEGAKAGHDIVMTPTEFAYLDYLQGDPSVDPPLYARLRAKTCYSFEPVPEGLSATEAAHILGGQGNLWTEQIPTMRAIEYMMYPRAWALSEVYWSPKTAKNWENFAVRMEARFARADNADVNYSRAIYDAIVKPYRKDDKLMLELGAELPGIDLYYTIDDTMPDSHSPRYTQPVEIPVGPVTLRVITYRNGAPLGHLITAKRDELVRRIE